MTEHYEAPEVKDLGSLSDLTLTPKFLLASDGFTFMGTGQSIGSL